MKISGFTFLRNARMLGFPFVQSIKSILPIVDEFIIALGPCEDNTEKMILEIGDPKIKIIHTTWNDNMQCKGYVYAQQKNIALYNCTGDWAFYLEGDEVIHENDLPAITASMKKYENDSRVEALVFDYIHFYGNKNTYAWSPAWYKKEVRIIKNSVRYYAIDGLFFLVVLRSKKSRYPRAAHSGARIYHYGWIRSENEMNQKQLKINKYMGAKKINEVRYADVDGLILKEFKDTHPEVMNNWLPESKGIFKANPSHKLTKREKKHRIAIIIEKIFGIEFGKKHYKPVK